MYEIERKYLVPKTFLTRLLDNCEIRFINKITNFYLPDTKEGMEHRVRKVESQFGTSWLETKKSKELGVRVEIENSIEESKAWELISAEDMFFNSKVGAQSILKKTRYNFTKLDGVYLDEFDNALNGSYIVEVEATSDSNDTNPMDNQPDWFKKLIFQHSIDVTNDERLYNRNLAVEIV